MRGKRFAKGFDTNHYKQVKEFMAQQLNTGPFQISDKVDNPALS